MADVQAKSQKTATQETPESRDPQSGDTVWFRGYTLGDESRPGYAANCVGMRVTLSYLTRSGAWLSEHLCPYDPSGKESGSWRFR